MTTALRPGTLDERSKPVKAVRVYLRQSKEQDQQRESIFTQRAECERLARALSVDWATRVEYVDVDRSGDDFAGREELQRLLREAEAGDVILAWKQDRLGRDMIDSAATIRELVKYRRCVLYTVETGTAPVTLDSAEQTAMVMFRGMVAQGELERIRSRTRDGLRQRAREGYAAGPIPFGYVTVLVDPTARERKQSKKRIEIDESAAPVVRRIFDLYLEGKGYASIAKTLNRDGVAPPRGAGWSSIRVWEMLREGRYAGLWTYGKKRMVRREGTRKIYEPAPESEIIRADRPDLAIVTPDVFARVQTAIADRTKDTRIGGRTKHMLSGILRCSLCGGVMRVHSCHGRSPGWVRRYYCCSNRVRLARCTNPARLPGDETEQKVTRWLSTDVLDAIEAKIRADIRAEVDRIQAQSADQAARAEQLKEQIETLRRERQRLVRVAAASDDPVSEIVEALKDNQERSKALENAYAIATRPPLDATTAERLEAAAVAEIGRMREQLTSGEAREAMQSLVPAGLRFKIANGLWLIEGLASVPNVRNPSEIRPSGRTRPADLRTSAHH